MLLPISPLDKPSNLSHTLLYAANKKQTRRKEACYLRSTEAGVPPKSAKHRIIKKIRPETSALKGIFMTNMNNNISQTAVSRATIYQLQQDVKNALEEVMGDSSPEMLNEMASIFLEDAVPLIEQIKNGSVTQDPPSIILAAHTLKGSSATIGLEKFAQLCLSLETSGKQDDIDTLNSLIPVLEAEYEQVQAALRGFLF